jgi:hypothetical protein
MADNPSVTQPTDMPLCHAGRTAFFGGSWTQPCPEPGRHAIGSPNTDPIRLCDEHFRQVNEAGLVTEPFIAPPEFDRREAQRTGTPEVKARKRWFGR